MLAERVRTLVARADVRVFVMRPGGPGGGFGPPPGDPGAPRYPGAPGIPRFPNAPVDAGPDRAFATFAGVHGEFVRVGGTEIAIVPDRMVLEARAREFLAILVAVLLLALVAAWLIARWIAAQAVAPLIAVTAELRRFAGGDFTPNAIPLRGMSDVGQLIEAYNGAARQVAAAFDERERGEGRMRRFLADAGHELRTPLSIVTAYIEVLRKGGADDADVRAKAFGTLATETTRMRHLVDRLVALARLEQPETTQPAVVDAGVLATDAVAAIVAALVDNAVKYGAGSRVRVVVEHARNAVAVRVIDGGPGIAPADRERIFERFYRGAAQAEAEGSGLGLAIAARAATRAGGELSLERSAPGETVFVLRLPLYVAATVR